MRVSAGIIRWLASAIALAIVWPAHMPFRPTPGDRPMPCVVSQEHNAARVVADSTIQRFKANLDWFSPGSQPGIDLSEDSDEGDDGRHFTTFIGIVVPHDLPSLIPDCAHLTEPVAARKSLPLAELCRLRC